MHVKCVQKINNTRNARLRSRLHVAIFTPFIKNHRVIHTTLSLSCTVRRQFKMSLWNALCCSSFGALFRPELWQKLSDESSNVDDAFECILFCFVRKPGSCQTHFIGFWNDTVQCGAKLFSSCWLASRMRLISPPGLVLVTNCQKLRHISCDLLDQFHCFSMLTWLIWDKRRDGTNTIACFPGSALRTSPFQLLGSWGRHHIDVTQSISVLQESYPVFQQIKNLLM